MKRRLPNPDLSCAAVLLVMLTWLNEACADYRQGHENQRATDATIRVSVAGEGKYELNEIGLALKSLADSKAWDEVIHVELPAQENFAEMILVHEGVDFYSNGIDVDFQRFREEAKRLSLTPISMQGGRQVAPGPPTEFPMLVEIRGDWPNVATLVIHLIKGIYGTAGEDEVVVRILE